MVKRSRIVSKLFFIDRLGLKKQKENLKEQFDLLVIGFGKAGKTLAGKMASLGKKVALVEEILLCLAAPVSISVVIQSKPSW